MQEAGFQNELLALLELDHPNILKLHEVFEDQQKYALVVETIDNYDLLLDITCHENFSEQDARHYIFQALKAIAYGHTKGVVHCDLKPEYIQVDKTNGQNRLIITEFGSFYKYKLNDDGSG